MASNRTNLGSKSGGDCLDDHGCYRKDKLSIKLSMSLSLTMLTIIKECFWSDVMPVTNNNNIYIYIYINIYIYIYILDFGQSAFFKWKVSPLASGPVDSVEACVESIIIVPNILFLGLAAAFRGWMDSNSICVSIKSVRCQPQTNTNSYMSLVTLEFHNTASRGFTRLLLHRRVSPAHKILVGAANRVAEPGQRRQIQLY